MGADGAVGDADRERVTAVLREHMAAGRLSLTDYQARLRRVRAATTAGELDAVLHGLPTRRDTSHDSEQPRPAGGGLPVDGTSSDGGAAPARRGGCAGMLLLLVALCVTLLLV
ncbi:DUF1707 SHOCT-like domain-containing protein [Yinghuangia seranimata]|uniref:DUF1707 SHOCT-like domain-containing protein n=1 Tax=Yinghuangia seranimata TaxID=408067 RepID=UPI00248ABDAB|nr:DUF1707 domain-containing protein [Yinghuangia seranimata]MDI2126869.1 DUF1707 domain-containing protein [Yinghuangia seranimata]